MDPDLTNICKLYLHILIINEMKIFIRLFILISPFLYSRFKQAIFFSVRELHRNSNSILQYNPYIS
jgi:hypothetical protein